MSLIIMHDIFKTEHWPEFNVCHPPRNIQVWSQGLIPLGSRRQHWRMFPLPSHEMGEPRVWLPSPVLLHWLCVNSTSWIKLNLLHFFIITHSISHLLFLPLTASYIFIYNLRRQQIENCGKVWLWSNGKFPDVRTTQQPMVGKATKQLYYISYHNSKDSWNGKIIILQDYQSSQKNNVFLAIHFKFGSFLCYLLISPPPFFFNSG